MRNLTFEQRLDWLEQAQRLIAEIHGWEAALQPSGTLVRRPAIWTPAEERISTVNDN
jgi:hypothetical protein